MDSDSVFSQQESSGPLWLRAHHILCLQGFRGKGYSPEFASNLAAIAARLKRNPATEVVLVAGLDEICAPCPHRGGGECLKDRSPDGDPAVMDLKVMRKLALLEGQRARWLDILLAVKNRLNSEELEEICRSCQWFAEGYCLEGLENLLRGIAI